VIQDFQEVTNLSSDLSRLRIDRVANSRHPRRRQVAVGLLFAIAAASYFARGRITAQEVVTTHPTVTRSSATQSVPILSAGLRQDPGTARSAERR